ncbi:MAG: hypothetical protein FJY74_07460 [Candidatus Eisenbacteria bacterium]|nr:hypothetical protein [Candidatus Eisenbacteria bacterium]
MSLGFSWAAGRERRDCRVGAAVPAVLLVLAAALARPAVAADLDRSLFVPVDELRPGDRCVGRTVFSGSAVEEFEIEIVGVVRGEAPQSDLIIARASGGPLEKTGILAGMSGSPVYLGGRLVGAIASTWSFSKEPIAGVTPIAEMLPALDLMDGASRTGDGTGGTLGPLVVPGPERAVSRAAWLLGASGAAGVVPDGSVDARGAGILGGEAVRLPLPLVVSGGSDAFLGGVSGVLAGLGFTPVRGASGGAADEQAGEPVPGSAIGVQLVRGDANWTAVGTLTHREDDRVIAFGHPLFQGGEVELPMVGAYVHALLPLQSMSFKYATGSELLGTMVQDRRRMVAGRLGPAPKMIGLSLRVVAGSGEPRSFEFEVARARPYSAVFAGLAVAGALDEVLRSVAPSSVELRARISTDAGPLEYAEVLHTQSPAFRVGGEIAALMDVVLANAFERREISSVSLDVAVLEEERWAAIERVSADRAVYRPGEDVLVSVTLRQWQGGRVTRTAALRVPPSTPDGRFVLRVASAQSFREGERQRLGDGLRPRNYEQLLSLVERSRPGNALVAQLLSDGPGVSLSGQEMRSIPGRAALAMARAATSGVVDRATAACVAESEIRIDREARGTMDVVITVARDR